LPRWIIFAPPPPPPPPTHPPTHPPKPTNPPTQPTHPPHPNYPVTRARVYRQKVCARARAQVARTAATKLSRTVCQRGSRSRLNARRRQYHALDRLPPGKAATLCTREGKDPLRFHALQAVHRDRARAKGFQDMAGFDLKAQWLRPAEALGVQRQWRQRRQRRHAHTPAAHTPAAHKRSTEESLFDLAVTSQLSRAVKLRAAFLEAKQHHVASAFEKHFEKTKFRFLPFQKVARSPLEIYVAHF
jgi:hypothetical protein